MTKQRRESSYNLRGKECQRVIACVVGRNGRLLVCQRPPEKRHGGLWEFPGGKIEPGESNLEAARRELSEEVGVDVLAVGAVDLTVQDKGSNYVIEFIPVEIEGDPACQEHSALAWATLHELTSYDLAPSDRRYAEFLAEREPRRPA